MFLSKDEIKNRWFKEINSLNERDYFLYIDNPFCLDFCSFCIYSPTLIKWSWKNSIKDNYYNNILIKEIDFYGDILSSIKIKAIYFWWWTSSVMSLSNMEKLFQRLQKYFDFKDSVLEKTFEFNPILMTKEKLDLLKQWNFTNITMWIQSFNKDVLDFNNRHNLDFEKMQYFFKLLRDYNFQINADLMVFIYKDDLLFDLKNLKKDIEISLKYLRPDRLTIFPNYHKIFDKNREYNPDKIKNIIKNNYLKISLLRNMLSKIVFDDYYTDFPLWLTLENSKANYYFLRKNTFKEIIYNCTWWSKIDSKWLKYNNVIALWWYWDRRPYSYIWDEFCYHNVFDNWEIKYNLFFDKDL